ncbi:hypothetical protein [Hyphomonas oceanitis]|uniref:Transmembrane protein n=1 Tax=Hyphomonas oceanitis SCH89 TaxID=1280953 RepID=A0A059GC02_9PROT|nr:hypothetical protein [Hyphomonas oceanitis]KDA04362.1 hypothetical protein HOC_00715 [Hyphomonas oceanitis SCH89]
MPRQPAIIALLDFVFAWVFNFSSISLFWFVIICVPVGVVFVGLSSAATQQENPHVFVTYAANYLDAFGSLTHSHFVRGTLGMMWIGLLVLIPVWIVWRLACLPVYLLWHMAISILRARNRA